MTIIIESFIKIIENWFVFLFVNNYWFLLFFFYFFFFLVLLLRFIIDRIDTNNWNHAKHWKDLCRIFLIGVFYNSKKKKL